LFDNIYSGIKQIWGLELATLNDTLLSENTKKESIRKSWKKLARGLKPEMAKELKGDRSFANRKEERAFHFVKAQSQRGFQDLQLEDGKRETTAKLLRRCKLRLFSWSPDSTRAVFSVWMDDHGNGRGDQIKTYVVDENGTNMREIMAGEFSSLVWLSSEEFLEKVNDNLWKFNLKEGKRERTLMTFTPEWCRKLNPASKLYTIQIKEKSGCDTAKSLDYPAYITRGGGAYPVGIGGYGGSIEAVKTAENIRRQLKLDYRIKKVEANSIDLPVEFGCVASPQGHKVAFIRNDGYSVYWYSELWIMNPDRTDETRIVSYMANFDERSYRPHQRH